jgi:hypothetical protein
MSNSPFTHIFEIDGVDIPDVFEAQFLHTPDDPYKLRMEGTMHKVWHNPAWLAPLFWLMGKFGLFIPYKGEDIPTTVEITPGHAEDNIPTHAFKRKIYFPKPYEFNTVMLYDPERRQLAEMLGPSYFLYMVWEAAFSPPDTFTFSTDAVALKFGKLKLWLPRWMWIWLGKVEFRQKSHSMDDGLTSLDLVVKHPLFKDFFGYSGSFRAYKIPKSR